jgi:hypothetical protein
LKLNTKPGSRYISRVRSISPNPIKDVFERINRPFNLVEQKDRLKDTQWLKENLPFTGELFLGHLRYGTYGKNSIESCHPFLRQNNWKTRNLVLAGNFNLTNVDELFQILVDIGQHPKEKSDTITVMEKRSTPQNSTYKSQSKKFKQSTKQGATELNNPHNFAETTNTEINQSRFSKAVVYESSKSINNNESIDENDQVIPITKDDNVDKTYYNNLSFINPNLNLENAAYEPEFIDGEKMKNKYTSLELVFGVGLAPGFGKTKTYSGIDLSPIIGLNYVKRLDRTFSFECALLYNYRGKIEQDHKEQSQIKLAEKLHIFNVPAYFNYRSDRHNYLIGAQLSYIPAQSSTITINNTNQFWDKNVGYTHFDGALSLGYEYVVSETLNIGTRINLGLFDYTDEAIFTGNNRHQDLQFRIQIDHKLK